MMAPHFVSHLSYVFVIVVPGTAAHGMLAHGAAGSGGDARAEADAVDLRLP